MYPSTKYFSAACLAIAKDANYGPWVQVLFWFWHKSGNFTVTTRLQDAAQSQHPDVFCQEIAQFILFMYRLNKQESLW